MESVKGKASGGFSFWWHCKDSAMFLRFFMLWFLVLSFMSYEMYKHIRNSTEVSLSDFSTVETSLYVPSGITNATIYTGDLARIDLKSKQELERADKNPIAYTIDTARNNSGGLNINHTFKPTNESTHLYQFTESIAVREHNFWFDKKPIAVSFNNGKATVNWEYKTNYLPGVVLLLLFVSLVIASAVSFFWCISLKKRWAKLIG